MLGVNLIFAGFALTLNGLSYRMEVDNKVKAIANILVGLVIGINAIFMTAQAANHVYLATDNALPHFVYFGFSAAMWMFSLNYFVIAAHILLGSTNWKVFGVYSLFAMAVSFVFAADTIMGLPYGAPVEMVFLWLMWAVLWLQSVLAILFGSTAIDKFSPHILVINGVFSTFIPGILILLGVIL